MSADNYDEARPWERPGAVRRDCAPHRGDMLLLLGAAAMVCGLLTFLLWGPGFIGLLLGILVLVMAARDLAKMRAGLMDPRGRHKVELARAHATTAIVASLLGLAICGALLSQLFKRLF